VQKACKSSELFNNNGDKQEIVMNSGLAHGTEAKCLGVLKSERNTVERHKARHLGTIRKVLRRSPSILLYRYIITNKNKRQADIFIQNVHAFE
jgi:hypothetical protein